MKKIKVKFLQNAERDFLSSKPAVIAGAIILVVAILVIIANFWPEKSAFAPGNFIAGKGNEAGTITDKNTGLMWIADPSQKPGAPFDKSMNWASAKENCDKLVFAGHSDWRLPTIRELMSIVDYSNVGPSVNKEFFPGTQSNPYWSATVYANNGNPAWLVHFSDGSVFNSSKDSNYNVRCVRGK